MTPPGCKILVVDDDAADRKAIMRALRSAPGTFQVNEASTVTSGLQQLSIDSNVDCMVVDYRLPDGDATTLLAQILDEELGFTSVPVVVVTGTEDERVGVSSLQQGAQDYLFKSDVNSHTLTRAIRYAIERHALHRSLRDQEQQLRQASKLEAIGQLAGGIAHDFNNMLTVIIGLTSRALQRFPDVPALENDERATRHDLERVLTAAERSAELTQQILAFARKQTLTTQVVDLGELVQETELLLGRVLGKGLELKCELETGAFVNVDAGQVGQVIMNLTLNARDSMPDGGTVSLGVSIHAAHADMAKHVKLTVSDTGYGIAPADLERIFDPFFTTKELGKGTGLGLSVVHGIVAQSGGTISATSEQGLGTTFEVRFPCVANPQATSAEPIAPQSPKGGETVLIVEDEALVLGLIKETLELMGFQVLAAPSAEAARALWASHPGAIDLLLTDLIMPGIGGQALASQLTHERPDTKVLYMSGYARDSAPEGLEIASDAQFIQKPMRPRALLAKVREVLGHG